MNTPLETETTSTLCRRSAATAGYGLIAVGLGGALEVAQGVVNNFPDGQSVAWFYARSAFEIIATPLETVSLAGGGLATVGGAVGIMAALGRAGIRRVAAKLRR